LYECISKELSRDYLGKDFDLTETCDKANKTQFITDVEVTPTTTSDVKGLPGIQKRLEEVGMKPEEHYADAGFVNGQTIVDSHDRGISLEGPSSGRSQSFEKFGNTFTQIE